MRILQCFKHESDLDCIIFIFFTLVLKMNGRENKYGMELTKFTPNE